MAGRDATVDAARRSVVLEVVTRLLFHTIVVFSIYLLFSGHNAPGGGFAGGLVAGLALVLRYLAGGRYELGEAAPGRRPGCCSGTGLLVAGGTALGGLLAGGDALQTDDPRHDAPGAGRPQVRHLARSSTSGST